jgi:hypothetical protein
VLISLAKGVGAISAACVLAMSCGALAAPAAGSPKSPYAGQMTVPGKQLATVFREFAQIIGLFLRNPIPPTAGQSAAKKLADSDAILTGVQRELVKIHPPPAAATAHRRLIVGTRELAAELKPVITKLHTGNLLAASNILSLPGTRAINSALAQLKKAGYSVLPG